MTKDYSRQPTPLPPKQPLFLSKEDVQACYDIDKASLDSRMKLEFLVAFLTTEMVNFTQRYPNTNLAGLMLNVDVLLPVYEEIDNSILFFPEGEGEE